MIIKRIAGVEFTDNMVRAVEIYGSEKSHRITAIGSVEISDNVITDGVLVNPEAAAAVLRELWKKFTFKSKEVIFGVDNKYVLVRYADIKKTDDKKFANDVDKQIQQFLPVDKNSVETDFLPLSESEGENGQKMTKTLIVAAGKKMLGDYIGVFKAAKLRLEDIDVNTLAIYRLLPDEIEKDKGTVMINFKRDLFNLLVVKDKQPLLARNIMIDTSSALNETEFVQEYFEAISKDIVSSLAYYNSITNGFIEKIYITGYGVWNEGMTQFLRETTKADVSVINPFTNAKNRTGTPTVSRPYEFAIAYALAQRGLESE
ncbi:MAG: pilus assembly protein PilM [Clostridia bacterium]|nr:pilus assembly protein PilM [Clostridia bacterium]